MTAAALKSVCFWKSETARPLNRMTSFSILNDCLRGISVRNQRGSRRRSIWNKLLTVCKSFCIFSHLIAQVSSVTLLSLARVMGYSSVIVYSSCLCCVIASPSDVTQDDTLRIGWTKWRYRTLSVNPTASGRDQSSKKEYRQTWQCLATPVLYSTTARKQRKWLFHDDCDQSTIPNAMAKTYAFYTI